MITRTLTVTFESKDIYMKTLKLILLFAILVPLSLSAQQIDVKKLSGLNTRSIGPSGMSGRITAIDVVETNSNVIYVGAASGGIWKTETGGLEWTPIFDDQKVVSIGSLCIYQANPDIVWAGTGEGNPRNSLNSGYGIYKSLDGGKSWECKGLENTRNIHRVIIDPGNSDIVYVGAIGSPWGPHSERGVYKTTDGGESWDRILFENDLTGCADLVMDPNNPNKLIAAMWEHKRWPWFFKSGGKGSGMHITWDGGKTWRKMTEKDGLPKGELGRMGLAIAPSNSKRVYAIIESKENAFYRSDDGGFTWRKTTDENIGDRPFYYYDIFVDPLDPDRIYSLYSRVNKSEDGGMTFDGFLRGGIHPDHHAWYINPRNPDFMIDGNDGGLAITYDRGGSWRFVSNLPLAQYYHINYDLEFPYNVYGGMQDNGSWFGPSTVFSRGGIQYYHWQTLMGGDGFDVVPDSSNSRYGYAMSQGGSLGRYDKLTGNTQSIRPIHPEGLDLRFHWNAAIAHDPFDKTTIYYGSQYLHKSINRGDSWEIISPDLTTNDPEKQKQKQSGGLTFDVTGAENHCTIIAISPSPLKKEVVWVGTDDGNIQLTQDGGQTWTNFSVSIKGVPENAWIPQIHSSDHIEGEAFVVVNNYRQNDFKPYLLHTTNFGKSWKNIVNEDKIFGYTLCIVQDPVVPGLLFLGSENGMYFSIDKGINWNKWTKNYPSVSTMDIKIHPREHDLIIGTFGRSAYIIDDIRPLRKLAEEGPALLDKKIVAFPVPVAYHMSSKSQAGVYGAGNGYFSGKSRSSGAILSYSVNEPIKARKREGGSGMNQDQANPRAAEMRARMGSRGGRFGNMRGGAPRRDIEPVNINIYDESGKKIRVLTDYPSAGINRTSWSLNEVEEPKSGAQTQRQGGSRGRGSTMVLPGIYKAIFSYGGETDSVMIEVDIDPRLDYKMSDLIARKEFAKGFKEKSELLTTGSEALKAAKASLDIINQQIPKGRSDEIRELREKTKAVGDTLSSIMNELSPPRDENAQGIVRGKPGIQSIVSSALRSVSSGFGPITGNQKTQVALAEEKLKKSLERINKFFGETWPEYKSFIDTSALSPFTDKPFKSLKW